MPFPAFALHPLDHKSAYFEGAVQIYVRTWRQNWHDAYNFFLRHALRFADYRGFVAVSGGQVIGMGFGNRSEVGQWWHDKVAEQVGANHPALQNAWSLTELAVMEGFRGHGIGEKLHNALLAAQPCPRVLLSTEVSNYRARKFYERHGWLYLHSGFAFNVGQAPYAVMCKEIEGK